uniref:rap guanine nucleotide exchange factor 1-like isoform X2 n=1 Tax=Myxine glutinosa TaxID=7769 RepID=UPI00358E88D9
MCAPEVSRYRRNCTEEEDSALRKENEDGERPFHGVLDNVTKSVMAEKQALHQRLRGKLLPRRTFSLRWPTSKTDGSSVYPKGLSTSSDKMSIQGGGSGRLSLSVQRDTVLSALRYCSAVAESGVSHLLPLTISRVIETVAALLPSLQQHQPSSVVAITKLFEALAELTAWADAALVVGGPGPDLASAPALVGAVSEALKEILDGAENERTQNTLLPGSLRPVVSLDQIHRLGLLPSSCGKNVSSLLSTSSSLEPSPLVLPEHSTDPPPKPPRGLGPLPFQSTCTGYRKVSATRPPVAVVTPFGMSDNCRNNDDHADSLPVKEKSRQRSHSEESLLRSGSEASWPSPNDASSIGADVFDFPDVQIGCSLEQRPCVPWSRDYQDVFFQRVLNSSSSPVDQFAPILPVKQRHNTIRENKTQIVSLQLSPRQPSHWQHPNPPRYSSPWQPLAYGPWPWRTLPGSHYTARAVTQTPLPLGEPRSAGIPTTTEGVFERLSYLSDVSGSPPPLPQKKNKFQAYMQLLGKGRPHPECSSPPALPPKQRHKDVCAQLGVRQLTDDLENSQTPETTNSSVSELEDSGLNEEENGTDDELVETERTAIATHLVFSCNKSENPGNPELRAGSVNSLFAYASLQGNDPFRRAFLATYRTFLSSAQAVSKLLLRLQRLGWPGGSVYDGTQNILPENVRGTFLLLLHVISELCHTELTSKVVAPLVGFTQHLLRRGELSQVKLVRDRLIARIPPHRICTRPVVRNHSTTDGDVDEALHSHAISRFISSRSRSLLDFSSQSIAEQITLSDAEFFYKIEIPELLLWTQELAEEQSPNLAKFTDHFNSISCWVQTLIVRLEKQAEREKLFLKLLKVLKHLRKLNNFNSYLAILSAIDSVLIRRLGWQKSLLDRLDEQRGILDSTSSFRAYRAALTAAHPPCIPYLGLVLQDLTFGHLGNPDCIDGKVNFAKRWKQFAILDGVKRFQKCHYEFQKDEQLHGFFGAFADHLAEDELWEESFVLRPRSSGQKADL